MVLAPDGLVRSWSSSGSRMTAHPQIRPRGAPDAVADRYWFDNSVSDERYRLRLLESIADPRSIRLLDQLPMAEGWQCAELGAGCGSMALWLAEQVGDGGSVVAVDKDVALLEHLAERPNIEIVEKSIEDLDLPPSSIDLIHTRNVLMHIDDADEVITGLIDALRPGGVLLVEEADYFPLAGMTSSVLATVLGALVSQWTWARTIPNTISQLPVTDIAVSVDTSMLQGGSPEAEILVAHPPVGRAPSDRSDTGPSEGSATREQRNVRRGHDAVGRRHVLDSAGRRRLRLVSAEYSFTEPLWRVTSTTDRARAERPARIGNRRPHRSTWLPRWRMSVTAPVR